MPPSTSMLTPGGVWVIALSRQFAIICASNSRSPCSGNDPIEPQGQGSALLFRRRTKGVRDVARDLGKIDGPESGPSRARLDLTDAQERVERFKHVLDVGGRSRDRFRSRVVRHGLRRLQSAQHAGEGFAQVVSNVGADAFVRQKKLFDAFEQTVEGAGEGGEIVTDRRERNSPAPVAGHDRQRRAAHRIDAAKELRAEPEAARGAERDGCR